MTDTKDADKLLVRELEAARMLSISKRKLNYLRSAGQVPFVRIGDKSIRYSIRDLMEWIANNTIQTGGNHGQQ